MNWVYRKRHSPERLMQHTALMKEKIRCSGVIFGYASRRRCKNSGCLEYEGKMFCKLHHPPTAQQRKDDSYAKYEAGYSQRMVEHRFKDLCAKVGLVYLRPVFLGEVAIPEDSWGLSEDDLKFIKSRVQ